MKKRLFTLLSILAISVGLMQAQNILTIQGQITDDSTGAPAVHHPVMVTSDTLLLPGNGGPGNPGNPPAGFLGMAFTDVQGNYSIDIDLSTLNLPEVYVITPVCYQTHQIVPLPAIAGLQLLNFTVCALNPGGGNPGGGNPGGGNPGGGNPGGGNPGGGCPGGGHPGGGNPGGGIPGMGCHAMFIGFPDSVNMLAWNFHALSMSPTAEFAWDFGNGSTAVGQDVTTTFPAFGQYNVCLILTDTAFQCADTMCILINVDSTWFPGGGHPGGGNPGGGNPGGGCPGGGNPGGGHPGGGHPGGGIPGMGCHAMFIGFPDSANLLAWNFHALPMSPTAEFAWDFGNGSTAVGQDVTTTFPAFGQYNVCLILTDTAFQCADTMCILINVDSTWFPGGGHPGGGNPGGGHPGGGIPGMGCHAMFIGFPDSANMLDWNFHALSMSPTAEFAWDFGNGSTAVGQDVTTTFPAFGQYNVCLILTDTAFQCADTMCILIDVDSTWHPGGGHPGGGNPGGGHPGGGNPGMGCHAMFIGFPDIADMLTWNFHALPMSPTAEFAWDFGNGSTAVGQDVTTTFPAFGQYNVCLILTDTAFQCADTMCILIDVDSTWNPGGGHPGGGNPGGGMNCIADFDYVIGSNGAVSFTDLSQPIPTQWLWDFGDGNQSADQNPIHTYTSTGTFDVTLTIGFTNCLCSDSTSQTITLPVSISTTLGTQQAEVVSFSQPYPNPVNERLFIDVSNTASGKIEMIVTDLSGKQILAKTEYVDGGSQSLEVNTSDLPAGMYLLILQQSSGKTMSYKFTRIR